jgi:redox-sensitive bicupin YhaK (pirin superfamily)
MNLMTAGHGIAHSEVSTERTTTLHGAQLWVALPADARDVAPRFEHYVPTPFEVPGGRMSVFLGTLAGDSSPVRTHSPLLGAEITVEPGQAVVVDVDEHFEHGVLVDGQASEATGGISGALELHGTRLAAHELGYLAPGRAQLKLHNPQASATRVLLLGGAPFGEQVLMWWNFVGRSNAEVAAFREQWQAEIGANGGRPDKIRFGEVPGYRGDPIPAPRLPNVPLKPRG